MKFLQILFAVAVCQCAGMSNVHALGPVDGEVGVALLSDELDIDSGSLFVRGEGWLGDKWGIRGAWFNSDLEEEGLSDQVRVNAEVRRRLLALTDNNFVALGLGAERVRLGNGETSSGVSLSAEGRFGVPGPLFFYGRVAWVPESQDAGSFRDVSSRELDAGIHFTPFPFISLRFGYLDYQLDYDDTDSAQTGSSEMSGFYLGAGVHW